MGKSWKSLVIIIMILLVSIVSSEDKKRPNIVFILADDMGWNDVGFTGQSDLQTPNIDALAYNGRILWQHYALPTCTPSRSALLTGKYPIRTGMQGYPLLPNERRALPLDQRLLPQYLKDLGYQTHLLGKWHLGHYEKKYTPTKRGFDSHFGYYNGYIGYYKAEMNDSYHDMWRNAVPVNGTEGSYITDLLTNEAVRIIQTAATSGSFTFRKPRELKKYVDKLTKKLENNKEAPFFLLLSHLAPHGGNAGVQKLKYREEDLARFSYIPDEQRRKYAATVWSLDKSVGRIVDALSANAILDNTIIVFASDNGAASIEPYANYGSNHPLRGLKFTLLEGGVRTAAVVWSPQIHTKPKGISKQMFHMTDWLPTLYAAAGGNLRDVSGMDGHSQWETLLQDEPEEYAVRSEMLLNIDEKLGMSGIRYRQWKLVNGTILNGSRDFYYETYRTATIPRVYNVSQVQASKAARAFKSMNSEVLNESEITRIRSQATITCPENKTLTKLFCNTAKTSCLFDLHVDPCERYNLASIYPNITVMLATKLETYMQLLKPQLNVPQSSENLNLPFDNDWADWPRTNLASRSANYLTILLVPLLLIMKLLG